MKLTCSQMDVLISFYIEEELSNALREQVEQHLKECSTCRAKFDIIKSMLGELHKSIPVEEKSSQKGANSINEATNSHQYRIFKTNLSAYLDNELTSEENLKIKKIAINNRRARKDLEDSYNIRRLMNDSFKKSKSESRNDFSRNVMRTLELEDELSWGIHPAVKLIIGFMVTVFVLTAFVLISLNI